jgi:hypothetical protein
MISPAPPPTAPDLTSRPQPATLRQSTLIQRQSVNQGRTAQVLPSSSYHIAEVDQRQGVNGGEGKSLQLWDKLRPASEKLHEVGLRSWQVSQFGSSHLHIPVVRIKVSGRAAIGAKGQSSP